MQPDQFQRTLDKRSQEAVDNLKTQQQLEANAKNFQAVIDTIGAATKALIAYHKKNPQKITVETPDFQKLLTALEDLKPAVADTKPDDTKVVAAIDNLSKLVKKLPTTVPKLSVPDKVTVKNQPDYTKDFQTLIDAVKALELSVTLPEKPEDYSTIVDALDQLKPGLDLSKYYAQDIDEIEQGVQYVGFLRPDGAWYVIRNEEALNKLRFKFGRSDYKTQWPLAPTFDYKLLDEAVNEVSA